ncbi:MAG: TRAP transporter substrate-binding protein DctP [Planctomycetes bacterium]|nr:TRAP transporter substrate-binding protein DctP [Planctomycetota bacterium]
MKASLNARLAIAWLFLFTATAALSLSGRVHAGTIYQLVEKHPADHHACVGTKKFADEIKLATNGRIFVQVHSNGALFTEQQTVQALRHGGMVFALINAQALATVCPDMAVLCAPDVFANQQHREVALNGRAGQMLLDRLKAYGIVGLAFYDSGFEVDSPPDLLVVSRPIWEYMQEKDKNKIRRAAEASKFVQDQAAEKYRASQAADSPAGRASSRAPAGKFLNHAVKTDELRDTYPEFFREVDFVTSGFIEVRETSE